MANLDYVLYDTAVFGVTAGVVHTLFQTTVNGDSTHTRDFTNMRGNGSLPSSESFMVDCIGIRSEKEIDLDDVLAMFDGSYVSLILADTTLFEAPLSEISQSNSYSGVGFQAAANTQYAVGLQNRGFKFNNGIMIPGGESFRVEIYQNTAMGTAGKNCKVMLTGLLNR